MEKLIAVIKEEIALLESWAYTSKTYGWSTNHVKAQEERATYLKTVLYDLTK